MTKLTWYHLSPINLDGKLIYPSVPKNFFTKHGYEDSTVKRISIVPDIAYALRALSYNLTDKEFYVHIPTGVYNVFNPSQQQVPDVFVTQEKWITSPVKMKCIGKIKVTGDSGGDPIPFTYGKTHEAALYDWNYEWLEKY